VFAHDALSAALPETFAQRLSSRPRGCVALGAQGPDLFLHNRRTKPSGLHYGTALHRKRFGRCAAAMLEHCHTEARPLDDPLTLYALAFVTHGILDRYAHPFVNYFGGWGSPAPGEPHSHAFFERILDSLILKERWRQEATEYDFYGELEGVLGPEDRGLPGEIDALISSALTATLRQAQEDDQLRVRIANAFDDAFGFYRYTNRVTLETLQSRFSQHTQDPDAVKRGLSLLHPIRLPEGIDYLNEARAQWWHPCDPPEPRRDSFWDLYAEARRHAGELLAVITERFAKSEPSAGFPTEEIAGRIGDSDLSDTEEREAPCRKSYSAPLPFDRVFEAIMDAIRRS
jgi:hypothetical protein